MRRSVITAVLFLGLMGGWIGQFSAEALASAPTLSSHIETEGSVTTLGDCIKTTVMFLAVLNTSRTPPSPEEATATLHVQIIQGNTCGGGILLNASGTVPLDPAAFLARGRSVTVATTATLFDSVTGNDVLVDLDFVVNGSGAARSERTTYDENGQRCSATTFSRPATVSGSVIVDNVDYGAGAWSPTTIDATEARCR